LPRRWDLEIIRIFHIDASAHHRTENAKEVNPQVPNPLAIGVTLGGLLLDVVAPRPKPRAGIAHELQFSPLNACRPEDTVARDGSRGVRRPPIASG
jgi:hypothetical protein